MDQINPSKTHISKEEEEEKLVFKEMYQNLLPTLPKTTWVGTDLYLHEGFWNPGSGIESTLYFQHDFEPEETDIILSSAPKAGTTWLKSLAFTIVNRSLYSFQDNPLNTTSPHELVPFVDFNFKRFFHDRHPRLFATHASYSSIPSSIKCSGIKIVYVCRNPIDQFISMYHFFRKIRDDNIQVPIEEAFDMFCRGIHGAGPFWDHVLEYWKAGLERPDKVLFLKYEDMKEDNVSVVKDLASFLGFPFSEEEEKLGLVQEISSFCSFESMKDFDANKVGRKTHDGISNNAFFRKGKVGDFINYLTPSMVQRMEQLMNEKFDGSGFSFNLPKEFQ